MTDTNWNAQSSIIGYISNQELNQNRCDNIPAVSFPE